MTNTIKVERAKKNWTQGDLAEKIGISTLMVFVIAIIFVCIYVSKLEFL